MMISVILEASENVDMIYIAGDKNHVSNSMEILCTLYLDLEVPHGNFYISDAQDGSAMLMMTVLDGKSASGRGVRQRETERTFPLYYCCCN